MQEAASASPVKEGEVISGRYRVDRVIGVGGMGVVVCATDQRLGMPVAVKFLLPHALQHPEIVGRFAREARAAVRIKSEHVARVMDVGTLDSGAPYMVMEYLQGHDLASELHAKGRLAIDDAIDYVLQASEALVEAHHLGFVHRDLKPANLFLVDAHGAPLVKVLDFGISKMGALGGMTGSDAAVTQTASLLGSPLYMSPEQMDSARNVDVRTDVWALGVILYELLTGRTPFAGDSIPKLCMAILNQVPSPIRGVRPDVPLQLEAAILRCLEKDRERRYRSVDELAFDLAQFAPPRSYMSLDRISAAAGANLSDSGASRSSQRGSAMPFPSTSHGDSGRRGVSFETGGRPTSSTQVGWGRTASERRGGYLRWVLIAVPVLAAAGVGAVLLLRPPQSDAHPAGGAPSAPAVVSPPASTRDPASAEAARVEAPVVVPVSPAETASAKVEPPPVVPTPMPMHPIHHLHPKPKPTASPAPPAATPPVATTPPAHPSPPSHVSDGWEDTR